MKYKKLFIFILIILNHGKNIIGFENKIYLKYFREEFDKIDLSESSSLLNQLVYATGTQKVRFVSSYFHLSIQSIFSKKEKIILKTYDQ